MEARGAAKAAAPTACHTRIASLSRTRGAHCSAHSLTTHSPLTHRPLAPPQTFTHDVLKGDKGLVVGDPAKRHAVSTTFKALDPKGSGFVVQYELQLKNGTSTHVALRGTPSAATARRARARLARSPAAAILSTASADVLAAPRPLSISCAHRPHLPSAAARQASSVAVPT